MLCISVENWTNAPKVFKGS